MLHLRLVPVILSAVVLALSAGAVSAQNYPNKPIRLIINAPGGGNDFVSRLIAPHMSTALGQPVVVDNRGNAVQSEEAVAKAPPDGYALTVQGMGGWTTQFFQKVPYELKDLMAVSLMVRETLILVVHPSLPVKTAKELIGLAKARPGELNYATSSTGGTDHISMELFKSMAGGLNIVRVSYKGPPAALNGLIAGEVQVTIRDSGQLLPQIKAGKVKALAVTTPTPSLVAPGIPTLAESGLPGYEVTGATGMMAPVNTPPAIINRINQEVVRALNMPDVKEKIVASGVEAVGSSPEQFAARIKSDMDKVEKLIKDGSIKID